MGTSYPEGKAWLADRIMSVSPSRVLDVGAGCGTYAHLLRAHGYAGPIDAIEIWRPYIDQFKLLSLYDDVYEQDARKWTRRHFSAYDVVMFGDVLEHMSEADAVAMWDRARSARYGAISIPIVTYPQGALNGNPHEVHHVEDWTAERVYAAFPCIADHEAHAIEGVFWARFGGGVIGGEATA